MDKKQVISMIENLKEDSKAYKKVVSVLDEIFQGNKFGWDFVDADGYDYNTSRNNNVELKSVYTLTQQGYWFANTRGKLNLLVKVDSCCSTTNKTHYFYVGNDEMNSEFVDDGTSLEKSNSNGKAYIPKSWYKTSRDTLKKKFWREHEVSENWIVDNL